MSQQALLRILEDRIQTAEAPSGAICTLCDRKLIPGERCVKLRAPINLIITTKIVEEYTCKTCSDLTAHRMRFIADHL